MTSRKSAQVVDEPQRAPRLDIGHEIFAEHAAPAFLGHHAGGLEGELDGQPQRVEIEEVQHLAVDVEPPRPVDAARQEEAGDQEEVGHAERPREFDEIPHPAGRARRLLDAERRMHHHHHDDANALGDVDPIDAIAHAGNSSKCRPLACGDSGRLSLVSLRGKRLMAARQSERLEFRPPALPEPFARRLRSPCAPPQIDKFHVDTAAPRVEPGKAWPGVREASVSSRNSARRRPAISPIRRMMRRATAERTSGARRAGGQAPRRAQEAEAERPRAAQALALRPLLPRHLLLGFRVLDLGGDRGCRPRRLFRRRASRRERMEGSGPSAEHPDPRRRRVADRQSRRHRRRGRAPERAAPPMCRMP